jgi:hypothetical protein
MLGRFGKDSLKLALDPVSAFLCHLAAGCSRCLACDVPSESSHDGSNRAQDSSGHLARCRVVVRRPDRDSEGDQDRTDPPQGDPVGEL